MKIDQEKKPQVLAEVEKELESFNIQLQSLKLVSVEETFELISFEEKIGEMGKKHADLMKTYNATLQTIKELKEIREHKYIMKKEIIQAKNRKDYARYKFITDDIHQKSMTMNILYSKMDIKFRAVDSSHIADIVGKSTGIQSGKLLEVEFVEYGGSSK